MQKDHLLIVKLSEIFSQYEETPETKDFYDEVFMNVKEACEDLIAAGMSEEAAIDKAIADMGDLTMILAEMSKPKKVKDRINSDDVTDTFNKIADRVGKEFDQLKTTIKEGEFDKHFEELKVKLAEEDVLGKVEDIGRKTMEQVTGFVDTFTREAGVFGPLSLVNQMTIPLDGMERIKLDYNYDNVKVRPSDDDNIYVREYMNTDNKEFFGTYTFLDGELKIKPGKRTIFSKLRTRIELFVPTTYNKRLKVETKSGNMNVADLPELDELVIETTSGSQRISNVSARSFKTEATSGSVKMNEVKAMKGKVEANSGSITVADGWFGEIKVSTSSGGINLDRNEVKAYIRAKSKSGSIKINGETSATMKVNSTSGSIRMQGIDRLSGQFETTSGSVRISANSFKDSVKFQSNSGSVVVTVLDDADFLFDLRHGSGSANVALENIHLPIHNKNRMSGYANNPNSQNLVSGEVLSGSIVIKGV